MSSRLRIAVVHGRFPDSRHENDIFVSSTGVFTIIIVDHVTKMKSVRSLETSKTPTWLSHPFFPKGFQKGVFDVISCLPIRVVIHDARMHADMRRMLLSHQDFAFDDVFEDNADNDALPLRVALAPC